MNYEEKLKINGLKVTPQRIAVLKFLDENRIHPTAEIIFAQLKKDFPGLSFATIYNTLNVLLEKNIIRGFSSFKNRKHYDSEERPHAHFICNVCHEIYDVFLDFKLDLREIKHHIDSTEVLLHGTCEECKKKSERRTK